MLRFFQTKIPAQSPSSFYRTILMLAISVILILIIFQPFGTYSFQHPYKMWLLAGYGLVILVAGILGFWFWKFLFKKWLESGDWTIGKELSSISFVVFVCITATYFYHFFSLGGSISLFGYTYFTGIALLSAIFPLSLLFTVRFLLIKNKLEKEELIRQQAKGEEPITLVGSNKDEKVVLRLSEFAFARTADNYVELIIIKEKQETEKVLLRNSLTALANQLEGETNCLRVHRSYLVNLDKIANMEGKSPDYYLTVKNLPDTIPVSRKMYPAIREHLRNRPV
jgi:DNA-binding LytR/AlgR family response regulator